MIKNTVPETMKVLLRDTQEVSSQGEIRIVHWDKAQRTVRALKFGAMCWGAAIVAVFIPLLHFVLVPAFLIAGPILGFIVSSREKEIVGGEGICPSCKQNFPIISSSFDFPISDRCSKCHADIKIEPLGVSQ